MDINIRRRGTVEIIQLRGDLRLGQALDQFNRATGELLESGEACLVINLAEVGMLDSSGIGALMKLLTSATKRGGALKLVNPSPMAQKTLKLVGLLTLFPVFPDEEQAVASFG
ncbi:MAG TPA: STAS domain-containing protein [Terriglobales bacterium]|nr:STAS domain-containing protein [Terriglobales bacterium]